MKMTRRNLIRAGGLAGAVAAMPAFAAGNHAALAIYDSRLPEGRLFARQARTQGISTIDIAGEERGHWRSLRSTPVGAGPVSGVTGWSDWVIVRGLLEEKGKRIRAETRLVHRGPRAATPFAWTMA